MQQNLIANPNESLRSYRLPLLISALLLVSGCVHLAILAVQGAAWNGPLSLRKPALFGISGGLTTGSIAWLMTQLKPKKGDRFFVNTFAIALLIEVALITMQYWRGVGSHFNNSSGFDSAIEISMLLLILYATGVIVYLSYRTFRLREIDRSMAIAIQGGMWLLALSCLLGIGTSVLGHASLSAGRSYETWGKAGVLKFPHGVALHAIQMLPMVAWLAYRVAKKNSVRIVQSTLAAQISFLVYAVWQTSQGRNRFDWDTIGGVNLVLVCLFSVYPGIVLVIGCVRRLLHQRKSR